jgi:hypothetical protein
MFQKPSGLPRAGVPRVVCFGECMLELQGQAFGTLRQTFGGDTLNTAVYLARCGGAALQVDYATALGDDGSAAACCSAGRPKAWARRWCGGCPGGCRGCT